MPPGTSLVSTYAEFPFIPTFDSVSRNARFIGGGAIESFLEDGDDDILLEQFDYVYGYSIDAQYAADDAAEYIALLIAQHGFTKQLEHRGYGDNGYVIEMIYLYHPLEDMTLLLAHRHYDNVILVFLGSG